MVKRKKKEKKVDIKTMEKPLSKLVYNDGIKPVIIRENRIEKIVLHPRRIMRLETETVDYFVKKYKFLKESYGLKEKEK